MIMLCPYTNRSLNDTLVGNVVCSMPGCPEYCDVCQYNADEALSTCTADKCISLFVQQTDTTCTCEASVIVQLPIKRKLSYPPSDCGLPFGCSQLVSPECLWQNVGPMSHVR